MKKLFILATAFAAASRALCASTFVDLQDLSLPANSFYNGSSAPSGSSSDFTSHGAIFGNTYTSTPDFSYWGGFSYSNRTDTTTPGYGNQYSAFPGGGSDLAGVTSVGGIYAVGYDLATLTLPAGQNAPLSMRVTNTTYAALSMRDGDTFAKEFGGLSGNDPDTFVLTIEGLGANNASLGKVEFYLADYRFALNAQDYIVSDWRLVDLTALGQNVSQLRFSLTSTSNGTPSYFALDNLSVVPEPACGGLLALAAAGLLGARRRKGSR